MVTIDLMLNRKFNSGLNKCKLGCLYCFADFNEFHKLDSITIPRKPENDLSISLYYPSCDTEFILTQKFEEFVQKLIQDKSKAVISISTKGILRKGLLYKIQHYNNILKDGGIGFIKFSVSFTTKYGIKQVEPRASEYFRRLALLDYICEKGIPTSVILKPILPFIPEEEYIDIVNDTKNICNKYLIGGLYVSESSEFFKNYIENRYVTELKVVDWLPYKPEWKFISSEDKVRNISNYISMIGSEIYESDENLVKSLWEENMKY